MLHQVLRYMAGIDILLYAGDLVMLATVEEKNYTIYLIYIVNKIIFMLIINCMSVAFIT